MEKDFTKRLRGISGMAAALLLAIFMLPHSDPSESVRRSLLFCAHSLVPSLFVSMVLGKMIAQSSADSKHVELRLIILGLICGFPLGAIETRELYENGRISKEKAASLLSLTNNASASFIVSYVGVKLLGNLKAGLLLLTGNAFATLLWSFILRFTDGRNEIIYINESSKTPISKMIAESAEAMLAICGSVVFFSSVTDLACQFITNGKLGILIHGFMELSGGVSRAGALKPADAYVMSAIFIGWSGMCVHFQVSYASGGRISIGRYYLERVFHASIMGLFALITKGMIM